MVRGTIWTDGHSELVVCDGNVNDEKYISNLDQGLLPAFHSGKLHRRSILFMQDGAPSLPYCEKDNGSVSKKGQNVYHGQVSRLI